MLKKAGSTVLAVALVACAADERTDAASRPPLSAVLPDDCFLASSHYGPREFALLRIRAESVGSDFRALAARSVLRETEGLEQADSRLQAKAQEAYSSLDRLRREADDAIAGATRCLSDREDGQKISEQYALTTAEIAQQKAVVAVELDNVLARNSVLATQRADFAQWQVQNRAHLRPAIDLSDGSAALQLHRHGVGLFLFGLLIDAANRHQRMERAGECRHGSPRFGIKHMVEQPVAE